MAFCTSERFLLISLRLLFKNVTVKTTDLVIQKVNSPCVAVEDGDLNVDGPPVVHHHVPGVTIASLSPGVVTLRQPVGVGQEKLKSHVEHNAERCQLPFPHSLLGNLDNFLVLRTKQNVWRYDKVSVAPIHRKGTVMCTCQNNMLTIKNKVRGATLCDTWCEIDFF